MALKVSQNIELLSTAVELTMAPEEKPSFYLYSIGYSPKILTLGTLVYDNYGMPETRRATFPMRYSQAGTETFSY